MYIMCISTTQCFITYFNYGETFLINVLKLVDMFIELLIFSCTKFISC
jgi:hypothetical protein